MGDRERYVPLIDFYPATLATGHLSLSLSLSPLYVATTQSGIGGGRLASSTDNALHCVASQTTPAVHRQFHNVISSVGADIRICWLLTVLAELPLRLPSLCLIPLLLASMPLAVLPEAIMLRICSTSG